MLYEKNQYKYCEEGVYRKSEMVQAVIFYYLIKCGGVYCFYNIYIELAGTFLYNMFVKGVFNAKVFGTP